MKARTIHRDREEAGVPLTRAFREHLLGVMKFDARNPEVQTRYGEVLRSGKPGPASSFSGNEANPLFRNTGAGFEEIGTTLGLSRLEDGRGLVLLDLDDDGAQDVVLHNFHRNPLVALLNRSAAGATWIRIRLRGSASNRFGIGARVGAGGRFQELACGTGYQSGNAPELHFGLGALKQTDVNVRWPSGKIESYAALEAGRIYTLTEGDPAALRAESLKPIPVQPDPPAPLRGLPERAALLEGLSPPSGEKAGVSGPALIIAFSVDCLACVAELREMTSIETRAREAGLRVVWAGMDADFRRVEEEFAKNQAPSRPWKLSTTLPTPSVYLLRGDRTDVFTGRFAVSAALEEAGRQR